ncbi:MBL fold metallo-hydrolase RNA specificity domain-containing protein [Salegentibacter sp. HM20]
MEAKVHFFGAAGTVTGSKFLLELPGINILIDCGVFQGLKELRLENWKDLPFPASQIDLVLLTHGHLDHCGYLPRLVKQGFKGQIRGTSPSLAVAGVILEDSAKIHEEEAERANAESYTKHDPALPYFTLEEAENSMRLFKSIEPETWYEASPEVKYRFRENGHIIGACFIEIKVKGKILVFSGDIGRQDDLLLPVPKNPEWADYLFLESTYGDRLHPKENLEKIFSEAITKCLENDGSLIIPSFAVERLQALMHLIWHLSKQNKIPNIPVFVDSPMGNAVLEIFSNYPAWHKLSSEDFRNMKKRFNIITSYADTWKTIDNPRPKIIIAGSGMVSGGRVLTYLRYYISKPETQVMLVGFQAEGTRGRQLQEGAHEIKIFGKYCEVKASILQIHSLSAHADQEELLQWIKPIKNIPEQTFLIHGEPMASDVLRVKIKDTLKWPVTIPGLNEVYKLQL